MNILITEPKDYSSKAIEILSQVGNVTSQLHTYQTLEEVIGTVDVLSVRLGIKLDSNLLSKAKKLKYILSATTGTDHIDMQYAKENEIQVVCLKGEFEFLQTIPSTSEYTWALLLALLRRLPSAYNHVQEEKWQRELFKGNNLKGKKIGLLGMGRVAKIVKRYAQAFDMEVGYYDPYISKSHKDCVCFTDIKEFFRWCEVLSIHIPYDDTTEKFLNADRLSHLKKGVVIVNTSRGGVWDEDAVSKLVQNGIVAGVATDVMRNELQPASLWNSSLYQLSKKNDRVIITPHIAGATYESMAMTEDFIANKFLSKLDLQVSE